MFFSLVAHPDAPPGQVSGVEVYGEISEVCAVLTFVVIGARPLLPPIAPSTRTDGLWKTTCFEMFVRPQGAEGYLEFNLSPSTAWAAYAFDGYRAGMRDLPLANAPVIEPIEEGIHVKIDLAGFPPQPWDVAVTAVIEENDGTKSYWALAHAAGPPDFHNPDCFIATLPAPERA